MGQNKDLGCYRKKQSSRQCAWRLRQLVLKPGFRPKGRAWVCRKSQKILTASDQYFLSFVKKITGGGVKIDPRPSRNRVNMEIFKYFFISVETSTSLPLSSNTGRRLRRELLEMERKQSKSKFDSKLLKNIPFLQTYYWFLKAEQNPDCQF